jgi:Tfp pilus assembly protein PilF
MIKSSFRMILLSTLLAGAARAQPAPLRQAADPGSGSSQRLASDAAEALIRGNDQQALRLAERAERSDDRSPWAHYDRAVALGDLRRVDDAVLEYQQAERRFSEQDTWGESVAIYGRAHLLAEHGRCPEAQAAFREYIAFVGPENTRDVVQAQTASDLCLTGAETAPAAQRAP